MGKIQKMITGVAVTFLCGMAGVVSKYHLSGGRRIL